MENITVNTENLSEEEIEQLIALITKANEPQKIWKPKKDEIFWIINEYGKVCHVYAGLPEDNAYFSIGNCFRTKEEAEFAVERLKVIHELKILANGFNPLKERKDGYVLGFNLTFKHVEVCGTYGSGFIFNDIPFRTETAAKKAIDTIGEERLKKYYFCIED